MCFSNTIINHPLKIVFIALILLGLVTYYCYEEDLFSLTPNSPRQYMVFEDKQTQDWDK